jgi:hypothetical protein
MHNFIAEFANTNSTSDKLNNHGYQRVYPWFLSHFKESPINLLEIGVADSESIELWKNYFKNVNLFVIDILPIEINDKNVKVFQIDQSKENELINFAKNVNAKFDIIIDDGSHVPEHQLLTLKNLWNNLKDGGVYIIEDIETSYWGKSSIYGYKFNSNKVNTVNILQNIIYYVNKKFLLPSCKKKNNNILYHEMFNTVETITYGHNCIILVKKDLNSFSKFYNDEYIRKEHINDRSLYRLLKFKLKYFINLFR